jgi:hypothetical protein
VAPAALLLIVAGMAGYYNYRVFGNAFTLPYQVNRATYASAPVFLWQQPRPEPVYQHKIMREFYSKWEMGDFLYARTPAGFLNRTAQKLGIVLFFFFGIALFPPLILLPRVLRDRRMRFLVAAGTVYAAGLVANAWLFPHYLAPFTCALYALLLQAMRHLRLWRRGGQPSGLALVRVIPVVCLMLAGLRLCSEPLHFSIPRWPTMWYGTAPLGLPNWKAAPAHNSPSSDTLPIIGRSTTGCTTQRISIGPKWSGRGNPRPETVWNFFGISAAGGPGWWNPIPIRPESHPIHGGRSGAP